MVRRHRRWCTTRRRAPLPRESEDARLMALVEARYNYRLRVSHREARLLQNVFDVNRVVWNTALGRWSDLWKYERISYFYKAAN